MHLTSSEVYMLDCLLHGLSAVSIFYDVGWFMRKLALNFNAGRAAKARECERYLSVAWSSLGVQLTALSPGHPAQARLSLMESRPWGQ